MVKNIVKAMIFLVLFTSIAHADSIFTKMGNFLTSNSIFDKTQQVIQNNSTKIRNSAIASFLICGIMACKSLYEIKQDLYKYEGCRAISQESPANIHITRTTIDGTNLTTEPINGGNIFKVVGVNENKAETYMRPKKLKCAGWGLATVASLAIAVKYWSK